ncbi:MAG: hypothetical protein Q3M24_05685 [Candidatus Electrothrix aestuarii]|uniref:HNH endonuclease n=1 Tax=Candidatus Electrothrix aestuarii TaxID=3062594 RepID=A0AAU8LZB3_9BACT|nr:hypothetical protein [Candidatus Electrothrix aestuarii]
MRTKQSERCYFCGKPATSSEHVPPKCIFPEQKDLADEDYRKNLITVPSCEKHNSAKSHDDEFLMFCLAPVVGNNGTGFLHTNTKLARSLARNPHLIKDTIRDARPLNLVAPSGTTFPVLVGSPDMERLCRSLQAVARGLYFYANGSRFKGKVTVIPSFVKFPPGKIMSIVQLLAQRMIDQNRTDWVTHGTNPRIFTYQIGPVDQFGMTPMVMTFYSRAEFFVAFQPKGIKLPHKNVFDATSENPIDVEITLGEGDNARKITWRCTGD